MFDVIIRNGLIIDGSGRAGFRADIGIQGDAIAAVDNLAEAHAAEDFDVQGAVVSPGFIDVHTHTDYALYLDNRSESQVRQGVTTELVGLCSFSLAPCTDATRNTLFQAFCTGPDKNAAWRSFKEYLDALESLNPATNIAALTGHAALRHLAMSGGKSRSATPDEVAGMAKLLDASMRQGSFGLSTGLEYHPGKEAQLFELETLCGIVGRHDGMHATHLRNRDRYFLHALAEALEITGNTGARLQISHINPKFGRPDNAMRQALRMIGWFRDRGCAVGMDVMPTNWNHCPARALLPSWANSLPPRELLALLRSREGRRELAFNPSPIWQLAVQNKWDKIRVFNGFSTARHRGKTIEELRREYSGSGWDTLCALLLEEGDSMHALHLTGESFFTEDILTVLQDPCCSVCSDTIAVALDGALAGLRLSPNAYIWCEEFLTRFIREEKALPLHEAIRRLTSLPAKQIGLPNRGVLQKGYYADIAIFRLENMKDNATIINPAVYPDGIEAVFINGCLAFKDGTRNAKHSGKVIRKAI